MVEIRGGNPLGSSIQGTEISIPSEAQGDLLYRNASNWVRLAAGTSGHFLKTLGAAANPLWASAGNLVLIETKTLVNAATTTFASITAGKLFLIIYSLTTGAVAGAKQVAIRVNGSSGAVYDYIRFNGAALTAAAGTDAYRLNIGALTHVSGMVLISGKGTGGLLSNAHLGFSSMISQYPGGTHEAALTGNWDSGATTDVNLTDIEFLNDGGGASMNGTVSLYEVLTA